MSEPEWVDVSEAPLIADESWYYGAASQNGSGPHTEASSWEPQDLSQLEDVPPVEPTLGGLGIVYPGKRHVFSGPQESAKTLAAYAIALQVVRAGGRVVLIDFEMGRWDARNRLRELGATPDEMGQVFYVEPSEPATPAVIERLVLLDPALVLIDAAAGAYELQGLDDNKRGDVEKFTSAFVRTFWKAGIATIVLDHVVKNAEGRGNYAIGSERKVGGTDVHLGFSVIRPISRGQSGRYKITTHKDRGGHLKRGHLLDFAIASDPETHHMTWEFVEPPTVDDEHPFRPTVLMERVSRFLEIQSEPVSQNTVLKGVTGNTEGKIAAVKILVSEGKVESGAKGLMSVLPYREDEDENSVPSVPKGVSSVFPEEGESGVPCSPLPRGGTGNAHELFPGERFPGTTRKEDDGIPF